LALSNKNFFIRYFYGVIKKIFSSTQSVRNCLTKAEKKGLIKKEGKNKKRISISSDLKLHAQGNILLDYKFLSVEA
jgi:hypothetical protein